MLFGEAHVPIHDRAGVPDASDNPGHRVWMTGPIERRSGIVRVDAFQNRHEAIRVALAPHLAVRNHVESGPLHVVDSQDRRIVLRLFEVRLFHSPYLASSDSRRKPRTEHLAVDKPVGLWIAADNRCHKCPLGEFQWVHRPPR